MNETFQHAGLLALFVALCVAAGSESVSNHATRVAAQRATAIAAARAVASQPPVRIAHGQADAPAQRPQ
jgi:hypothetical protein